ncbi:MAG: SpoIID/LytB domain-containing protein [Endomicrobia bacterium]|nr:SpoIID/LytB domain-containing protein [Endomicrobiia bacterium]
MYYKKFFSFFLFFINLYCEVPTVSVGISWDIKKLNFKTQVDSKSFVVSADGKRVKINSQSTYEIYYLGQGWIKFSNIKLKLPIFIYSNKSIIIANKFYPFNIEIRKSKNGLGIVNKLDVETYLYGVLPYEIDTRWNDEMLKVQAIVARTYALLNLGRHNSDGYDVCDSVHCQVYKGLSNNQELYIRVKNAVDKVFGYTIVDRYNNLLNVYYHAACGGETEDIKEVWGVENKDWLKGVKCSFCKNSIYFSWDLEISQKDFINLIYDKFKINLGKIKKIDIVKRTSTGRATELELAGTKGRLKIKSEDLRKNLGYTKLRSTKIRKIIVNNDSIVFYGNGWGHGVGLCQWGAASLAQSGKDYKEIIEFYFPSTYIKKVYDRK